MSDDSMVVCGVDLSRIRNRNEARVARLLSKIISDDSASCMDALDIQDIFALALNILPSRYRQKGTIVLSEPVKDSHIEAALRRAIRTVQERPKR